MKNSIETECWKPVPGFENYEASDLGRIRSLNYGRTGKTEVLNLTPQRNGYLSLNLYKDGKPKGFLAHSLIYTTFKGEIPLGMTVDHVNNDKRDNRLENLQLLTRGDNARKANLGKLLSDEHRAKLSEAKKGRKRKPHSEETKVKMRASQKARREREKNLE